MLDPITALGLTASIVQLLSAGSGFLSKCKEIYKSGSVIENIELASITTDLEVVNSSLVENISAPRLTKADPNDKALLQLAQQCQVVAVQLLDKLGDLTKNSKNRKWKSLQQAVLNSWRREEVDTLAKRLAQFRDQLQYHLLASIRSRIHLAEVIQSDRYTELDLKSQKVIQMILTNRDVFQTKFEIYTEEVQRRHDYSDRIAGERHEDATSWHLSAEEKASKRHAEARQWHSHQDLLSDQRHAEIIAAVKANKAKRDSRYLEQQVLRHLAFEKMTDREDEVAEAHHQTFEWIFRENSLQGQRWSDFVAWLEKSSDCYWINGKAGSGKSTLMKFIAEHPRTYSALDLWAAQFRSSSTREDWAPKTGFVTASFFFWRAGTYMQKSEMGLLQALVHEILSQCPEIISVVLPHLYEAAATHGELPRLSYSQLKRALRNVIKYNGSQFGIFLFIDGLDEYIADRESHVELAEFILSLCSSPNIKALVSSRPLPAFESAFSECPMLRLQELTKGDIEFYVHDRLLKHKRVAYLMQEDRKATEDMIVGIITKAAGVFLWVKLAVRVLLQGLQEYAGIDELQERLSEIPPEIDDLYMHMLDRIDTRSRSEAFQWLQLVHWFRLIGVGTTLTLLDLYFATARDSSYALKAEINPLKAKDAVAIAQRMSGRLAARCGGILEVHRKTRIGTNNGQDLSDQSKGTRITRQSNAFVEGPVQDHITEGASWRAAEVQLLHKTAADFLCQEHVQNHLNSYIDESFNPAKSLLWSCVLHAKALPYKYVLSLPDGPLGQAIIEGFGYAKYLEETTDRLQVSLLDEFDAVISCHRQQVKLWENTRTAGTMAMHAPQASFEHFEPFVGMALRNGMSYYFDCKLKKLGLSALETGGRPLLFSALKHNAVTAIKLLLQHGADPNILWHGMTPWAYACILFYEESSSWHAETLDLLIQAGADPNVVMEHRKEGGKGVILSAMSVTGGVGRIWGVDEIWRRDWGRLDFDHMTKLFRALRERGGRFVFSREGTARRWRWREDVWTADVVRNSTWGQWRLRFDETYNCQPQEDVQAVWHREDGETYHLL